MKNHFADIDEGRSLFETEKEREAAETIFKRCPTLFNHIQSPTLEREAPYFEFSAIRDLCTTGAPRVDDPKSPFDYEEGYAELEGHGSTALILRWTDYGGAASVKLVIGTSETPQHHQFTLEHRPVPRAAQFEPEYAFSEAAI